MLSLLSPTASFHLKSEKLTNYINTFMHQIDLKSFELILAVCIFFTSVVLTYKSTIQAAYTQEFFYETRKRVYKNNYQRLDSFLLNGKANTITFRFYGDS
jgi:hypothetical protein